MSIESYLMFRLQKLQLALDVSCIREIFPLPELIPVPEAPGDIVGLLNFRGQVLPVMHLARRLGYPVERVSVNDRVIVVEWQGLQVGMVVHEVEAVLTLDPATIETDLSYGRQGIYSPFLQGVVKAESGLILLLNPETLIRLTDEVALLMGHPSNGSDTAHNQLIQNHSPVQALQSAAEFFETGCFEQNFFEETCPQPTLHSLERSGPEFPQLSLGTDFYTLYCPHVSQSERDIFQHRAAELRHSLELEQAQDLTALAVIGLEDEFFGLRLESVREFITVSRVSPIPCSSEHIVGNINLRGEIMTLIDIRTALNLPQPQKYSAKKAVITQIGEVAAGIVVDEVRDILFLHPSDLTALPTTVKNKRAAIVQGIARYGDTLLSILNLPQLLGTPQTSVIET
jgi:purine-binding chemotaxis protein CheW